MLLVPRTPYHHILHCIFCFSIFGRERGLLLPRWLSLPLFLRTACTPRTIRSVIFIDALQSEPPHHNDLGTRQIYLGPFDELALNDPNLGQTSGVDLDFLQDGDYDGIDNLLEVWRSNVTVDRLNVGIDDYELSEEDNARFIQPILD